jgi:hypothetical protein
MFPISSLLSAVLPASIRASVVTQLKALGVPADKWIAGGTYSTITTVLSGVFGGFSSTLTSAIGANFLTLAAGGWLVLKAFYDYGVTAQAATFGIGTATFTNTGGGVYNYDPGEVVLVNPLSGNTFTNTEALSLGAGSVMTPTVVTIDIQAQKTGSLGGAPAGTITQLQTVMAGVTVTNAAAVLGLDADSDPLVVQKCLVSLAARSYKGPTGAYYAAIYGYGNVLGATNPVTGQPVNINRIQVYRDPDTGDITVYLASPSGAADPNDVIGCQTAILAVAEPMGVTATAASCTVVDFTAAITVWSTSAGTAAATAIEEGALEAADSVVAQYPIGGRTKPPGTQGYLFASFLVGAVAPVDPTIYAVDLSSWSALPLNPGQVAAVTSTVSVRQVST